MRLASERFEGCFDRRARGRIQDRVGERCRGIGLRFARVASKSRVRRRCESVNTKGRRRRVELARSAKAKTERAREVHDVPVQRSGRVRSARERGERGRISVRGVARRAGRRRAHRRERFVEQSRQVHASLPTRLRDAEGRGSGEWRRERWAACHAQALRRSARHQRSACESPEQRRYDRARGGGNGSSGEKQERKQEARKLPDENQCGKQLDQTLSPIAFIQSCVYCTPLHLLVSTRLARASRARSVRAVVRLGMTSVNDFSVDRNRFGIVSLRRCSALQRFEREWLRFLPAGATESSRRRVLYELRIPSRNGLVCAGRS